jgi:flagellar biosynthesis protein
MNPADARATAVALSYAPGSNAPVVVAKGYGATAESIMHCARESGVYVHESPQLVALLMDVQLDREIPPALYVAVAEVMAWIAGVDRRGETTRCVGNVPA